MGAKISMIDFTQNGVENKNISIDEFKALINKQSEFFDIYELTISNGLVVEAMQYYRP